MDKISSLDLHQKEAAMQKDRVSIIIACYNDAEYVSQSINSAYNQNWDNKEIIVIDDGSNKETKEVLASLNSKIDLLITQKNMGVSAARNNGIEGSIGKYILILDSDDFFEPTFCEKAIQVFQNNSDIKIVTCYSKWFDNLNHLIFKTKGGYLKDILISNIAMGSSMFLKKDWQLVGGYDQSMLEGYEDWEFYLRLLKSGGKAEAIPEVLFNYRNKKNSRNKKANKNRYKLLQYIYLKHSDVYKKHFSFFIQEWLENVSKSEAYKQHVMDSLDYKVGNKILKPFRLLGFFKIKNKN